MRTYLTADVKRLLGIRSKSGLHEYLKESEEMRAAVLPDEVGPRGSRVWDADAVDAHVSKRVRRKPVHNLGRFADKGAPPPHLRRKAAAPTTGDCRRVDRRGT